MFTLNSNRRWKRVIASQNLCNRAARRNAARILATVQPTGPAPTDAAPSAATVQRIYSRPYAVRETGEESWIVVRSENSPEGYREFRGPFKTTRGAAYFTWHTDYSIAECERLSKV